MTHAPIPNVVEDTLPLLAIDTSNGPCSVALFTCPEKPPVIQHQLERNQQASSLIPMIEAVLAEAALPYAALATLAVTTGPGSFSGLRIGIAAAKGLALALQIPLIGITSFDAHAFFARDTLSLHAPLFICLDASRGEYYGCQYALSDMTHDTASLQPEAELLAYLQAHPTLPLLGSGAEKLAQTDLSAARLFPTTPSPMALWVGRAALYRLAASPAALSPATPFYIRMADAKLPQPRQH